MVIFALSIGSLGNVDASDGHASRSSAEEGRAAVSAKTMLIPARIRGFALLCLGNLSRRIAHFFPVSTSIERGTAP